MNLDPTTLVAWLADLYVGASVVLALACGARAVVRQPARRLVVSWAALTGLAVLAGLGAVPDWPRRALMTAAPPVPTAPLADPAPGAAVPGPELEAASVPPTAPSGPGPAPPPPGQPSRPHPLPTTRLSARAIAHAFLAGAGVMADWLVLGALQAWVLARRTRGAPAELVALLHRTVQDSRRMPRLGLSDRIQQPVALGWNRPTIILPTRLVSAVPEEELRAILSHEWEHVRRGDLWLLALTRALSVVLYAHPLFWWLCRRIRIDQETLADASAAGGHDGAVEYADALLQWARLCGSRRLVPGALGLWERPSLLRLRIQQLLDARFTVEDRCPPSWRRAIWASTGLAVLVLSLVTLQPGSPVAGDTAPTEQAAASDRAAEPDQAAPTPLRYGWKDGESYVFAVRVEARLEEAIEVLEGTSIYQARRADPDQEAIQLLQRGRLLPTLRPRTGPGLVPDLARLRRLTMAGAAGPSLVHEALVDRSGHVWRTGGGAPLPFLLGDLALLVVEPLPEGGEATWELARDRTVPVPVEDEPSPFESPAPVPPWVHRPRFRPGMVPVLGRTGSTSLTVRERTVYQQVATRGDATTIRKRTELRTRETVGTLPRMELIGEGELIFDRDRGLPRSLEFRATLTQNTAQSSRRIPVTVTYRRLEGADRERVLHPPPPPPPQPLEDAERARLLDDLRGVDPARRRAALDRLKKSAPGADRAAVAESVLPALADSDAFLRAAAAEALGVWGTPETVPSLIERLGDESFVVRWAAIDALGRLGDPRAAGPLADRMAQDAFKAGPALAALGPAAEPEVRRLLSASGWTVRFEACKILKSIGTQESLSELRAAARDGNGLVAAAAREALQAISGRR